MLVGIVLFGIILVVEAALVGRAGEGSRPGSSVASVETTVLQVDKARDGRFTPPAGAGINTTIAQVTAMASADIESAERGTPTDGHS